MDNYRFMAGHAVCAAVLLGVGHLFAGTFCWTNANGDGDWTSPGNFAVGETADGAAASVAPGPGDTVYVPDGVVVTLEYDSDDAAKSASCTAFAAVERIVPGAGSKIDVTVAAEDAFPVSCAIAHGTASSDAAFGEIVKRGVGELDLNACGVLVGAGGCCDYYCAVTVVAGVVKLPQASFAQNYLLGKTTVGADGTLFLARAGSSNPTEFRELYGSGTITNAFPGECRMAVAMTGDFAGRIGGKVAYYSSGCVAFSGAESTFSSDAGAVTVQKNYGRGVSTEGYGALHVASFGMKGAGNASSIGSASELRTRDYGGAYRYIGSGETTDKDLVVWQTTDYPTYLDGGPVGGLVWTGAWDHHNAAMRRLVLQGSNTQECVMYGPIRQLAQGGTNYTFCVTKTGTGTWRIAHNDDSRMHGVWRVVNGTLRYDTIAEAGVNSALGSSTMLYGNVGSALALDENKVDYAFWLGGGPGGNRADLEYVGSTNCASTTRRFAVTGTGGVLNNGTGFLRLSDFVATNTAATLVLGGTNARDNAVDSVADGADAEMSVVKEGVGTWRLGTNCTFTGSLDVKDGKLIVGNPYWNYYRWVIKATFTTKTSSNMYRLIALKSFGLFDFDGNDRIYGLSHEGDYSLDSSDYYTSKAYSYTSPVFESGEQALDIDEGHFRITHYNGTAQKFSAIVAVTNLFLHKNASPYFYSRETLSPPISGTENTWAVFTMRPVPGKAITSWDYVNSWGAGGITNFNMISKCVLEASVDGLAWTQLAEVSNKDQPNNGTWQSDNATAYERDYATHTTGMPIAPGPSEAVAFAASRVSVASGAELAANAPEKPVIRHLVVDAATGGGTIDSFAFASDMRLEIENWKGGTAIVPFTFRNVSGADDVSGWTCTINGRSWPVNLLSVRSEGFAIDQSGFFILFR